MPAAERTVAIQNRHPRLRAPAAQIRRAIALLDTQFRVVPADLPTFTPRNRARARQSVFRNPNSAIPPACPPGELSLVFLTDPALAQIHADFMDDPSATDVITFDGDPAAGLAGEICVSADTAAAYVSTPEGRAPARPRSTASPRRRRPARTAADPAAFARELTLYLVHGWLHLAGYDDLRPDRKRRMRAAESRALNLLAAHGAIPAFALR